MSSRHLFRGASALALFALIGNEGYSQGSQEPSQAAQGGQITVSDSPQSITGQNVHIGQVIYQEARRDPITRRFVSTLHGFVRVTGDQLRLARDTPSYMFALDDVSRGNPSNEPGEMYSIVAGHFDAEEFNDRVAVCGIQSGVSAIGYVMTASRDDPATGRVRMRAITREDASILEQICRGLGRPLSSLRGMSAGLSQRRGQATIFDYLSRYSGSVAIVLMPSMMNGQDLEVGLTRYYWASALAARYGRLPSPEAAITPEIFDQLENFATGEWVEATIPIPTAFANPSEYPPQARSEFGARIDRLDADWTKYLAQAMVTIRNERHPVLSGGRIARFAPRFGISQVGTTDFWRAANDMRTIFEQANCIAQHFLSDSEYLPPGETSYISQCPLEEIRIPAS